MECWQFMYHLLLLICKVLKGVDVKINDFKAYIFACILTKTMKLSTQAIIKQCILRTYNHAKSVTHIEISDSI